MVLRCSAIRSGSKSGIVLSHSFKKIFVELFQIIGIIWILAERLFNKVRYTHRVALVKQFTRDNAELYSQIDALDIHYIKIATVQNFINRRFQREMFVQRYL